VPGYRSAICCGSSRPANSHLLFRDIVYHAPDSSFKVHASPLEALTEGVAFTSHLLARYLGSKPIGIRTPYGYYRGLSRTFLEYARARNVECLSYSDYYRRRAAPGTAANGS
jgi:hypothetical protein